MPDVIVEKPITLDLLDTKAPALSATSDMPVIETKPDSVASAIGKESKAEPEKAKPEDAKTDTAAPVEGKTDSGAESADDLEQPESTSANDAQVKKPAKGVQKRLDELTRQAREAERRAEAEREEKLRVLALLESRDKPKAPAVDEPAKPKREDFDSPEAYTEALVVHAGEHAAWRVTREFEAKRQAEQKQQAEASIAEQTRRVQEAYVARVDKFKATHPDYSEVAESPDVSVSIPMAHAIAHSEQGPEIAYYLGSNPGEASRISQLPPPVQLMELGLIVGKLTAPPSKPVSAAPPPIKPVKAGSETSAVDPENETMEQYAARRKKEMAKEARHGMRH